MNFAFDIKERVFKHIAVYIEEEKDLNLEWEEKSARDYFWNTIMHKSLNQAIHHLKSQPRDENGTDPLGEMYQFFFRHHLTWDGIQLQIVEKPPNLRNAGRVYTPEEIIYYMIKIVLQIRETANITKKEPIKIADISCGTGRFLTQCWIEEQQSRVAELDQKKPHEYYGYDIDATAIQLATHSPIPNAIWNETDALLDLQLDHPEQFDIILGNPPYIESRAIPDDIWSLLRKNYSCAYKKFDLSVVFLERIITLLKPGAWAGIILTNKWMVSSYGLKIREYLLKRTLIHYLLDVSLLPVFHNVATYPVIIIFQKMKTHSASIINHQVQIVKIEEISDLQHIVSSDNNILPNYYCVDQSYFLMSHDFIITTDLNPSNVKILHHFRNLPQNSYFYLGTKPSPYDLRKGVHTGNVKDKLITKDPQKDSSAYKKLITSRDKVERYQIRWKGLWIRYDPTTIDRPKGEYGSLREQWIFESTPKIMIKLFGKQIQAALDTHSFYTNNSLILLLKKQEISDSQFPYLSLFRTPQEEFYYLLGILNSKFISKYYRALFSHSHVRGGYLQYYIKDLQKIPIIIPGEENIHLVQKISLLTQELEKEIQEERKSSVAIEKLENQLESIMMQLYQFGSVFL